MAAQKATERLYYTADRDLLVREGDPRARYLATIPGRPMPEGVPVASKSGSGEKPKAPPAKKKPAPKKKSAAKKQGAPEQTPPADDSTTEATDGQPDEQTGAPPDEQTADE